jgi:hypothetical protein
MSQLPLAMDRNTTTPKVRRTFRQRRRGSLVHSSDQLKQRYDDATKGCRSVTRGEDALDPLYRATGDPLVLASPALARRVYGMDTAKRPNVVLRHIHARSWGSNLDSVVSMARQFQRLRGWSALRAAGEAVALAAERKCWIGIGAPVSFDHAVDLVRKGILRSVRTNRDLGDPLGWTGKYCFVKSASGCLVSRPDRPRAWIAEEGERVRDDAYWRRLLADGDVIESDNPEKITQR